MIADIRLQQYRSYLDNRFELSDGVNIIVGANASGKTNLIEAVMVVSRGSSYRTTDSELIMDRKDWARIDATDSDGIRVLKLSHQYGKELLINNKSHKRITQNTQIPIVLFEPNHLLLLSGSPELRRKYLDDILELIKPGYKKTKNEYLKTLRQRNALLKSGRATNDTLFPWNVRLSHLGGFIAASRNELTVDINKRLGDLYKLISNGNETITTSYKSSVDIDLYESALLKKLETAVELDLIRGFTAYGPHREDMIVFINSKAPTVAASRGENRSIIIALKIMESYLLESYLNQRPVILLDDVFSELDNNRREAITRLIKKQQILITTTDAEIARRVMNPNVINLDLLIK